MDTNYPERPGQAAGSELVGLGRWSALVCGLGAVAYGAAEILVGVLATSAITWESLEQFVSDYRPFPTLLVLFPSFPATHGAWMAGTLSVIHRGR
jgi:hypothetical protein